jgi:hypothetical protein
MYCLGMGGRHSVAFAFGMGHVDSSASDVAKESKQYKR